VNRDGGGGGVGVAGGAVNRIANVCVVVIAVVVAGGVYLAAYLPRRAPLGPAYALLAVAAGLLLWNVVSVSRLAPFAWRTFFLVGRWALLAYLVIAGMLEYVFVFDHTSGSILAVLTVMLAIFAVDIPLLLAFSVARYQAPDEPSNRNVLT
jgi:hypothetical protein